VRRHHVHGESLSGAGGSCWQVVLLFVPPSASPMRDECGNSKDVLVLIYEPVRTTTQSSATPHPTPSVTSVPGIGKLRFDTAVSACDPVALSSQICFSLPLPRPSLPKACQLRHRNVSSSKSHLEEASRHRGLSRNID
jgi:hypothetical protein